ncbi:integrin beta-8 [Protopterus annectens]|uniref:integrin beta-8 n=1 Tax=Protopterus annectens TaxID=7888 RepID=UPI001CFB8C6A|nr:integrin beta-8 [Protopterus annectens]
MKPWLCIAVNTVPFSRQKCQSAVKMSYPILCILGTMFYSVVAGNGPNRCTVPTATHCSACLILGPECAWCFQKDFITATVGSASTRCDTTSNLLAKGCRQEFIEHPLTQITKHVDNEGNTQVTPKTVSVLLRPGAEVNFILKIRQLENYPLDLYHLVDVSASMFNIIEALHSVGPALSKRMNDVTSDFRFGFGSFVDKTVSPFISIHPERIKNPCSSIGYQCIPPHGYIHVLSLTNNVTGFTEAVKQQQISGNIDNPEGGLDAVLQAAVCQNDIGWHKAAKRLLLMITDQTSHLALDSKLAGIVVPNDGNCHLENNVYTKTASMEYPSLGQLAQILIENNIVLLFAVGKKSFDWYKDLLPLIPNAIAAELQPSASNLINLVADAYKYLLSEVKIQIDNPVRDLYVTATAICPDGKTNPGTVGCSNVRSTDEVLFNITIGMKTCFVSEGLQSIIIRPIGFNETTQININTSCGCQCLGPTEHSNCFEELSDYEMYHCPSDRSSADQHFILLNKCRLNKDQLVCSGRGVCSCGQCLCHKTKLGRIYGTFCEMDDFSCPYHSGRLCSGNGQCFTGECSCFTGWEGESCNCSSSLKHCLSSEDGQICNGRGDCICGQCQCSDSKSSGPLCEFCPTCNNVCGKSWNCVPCNLLNELSTSGHAQCNTSCHTLEYYTNKVSECISNQNLFQTFCIICFLTCLVGLLTVLIFRQLLVLRSSSKMRPSPEYVLSAAQKDKTYLPSGGTYVVTYKRENTEEMDFNVTKVQIQ